jgi:Cu(I)/Ag(I) efflux system membrane fusion protein/cobalt-zinc-cadmium efflux system membrane fusion protein
MALRYALVREGPLEKRLRTVAVVAYNEQGLGAVTMRTAGWVQKVYADRTGSSVRKGQPLFEFHSPDLYNAQQEFLVALRELKNSPKRGAGEEADTARQTSDSVRGRLRYLNIDDDQISEIEATNKVSKTLTIKSKLDGVITEKKVVEGDYLPEGMPAYKIADLSTVWVIGKIYESDLPYVQVGQKARMTLDYLPGRAYDGTVTYIYPYLEEGTREVSVRTEFANPDYYLKPGMYATIEIASRIAEHAVLVPDMAVIDTGARKVAYVLRESGKFEPRELKIGVRSDADELQVLAGLAPGDRVVVSGQFLLDSESRLREASLKMLNPTRESGEKPPSAVEGKTTPR